MALSREYQEFHLTPQGWIDGNFKADSLGASESVETPKDRVLTIRCHDQLSSAFSKPNFYDEIVWESEDKNQINQLKNKYGEKPDCFGYKSQGD